MTLKCLMLSYNSGDISISQPGPAVVERKSDITAPLLNLNLKSGLHGKLFHGLI
jgi:hypothetical protein